MPLNALLSQSCQNKINPKMNIFIYFDYDDIFKLIIYFEPKNCCSFSIFKREWIKKLFYLKFIFFIIIIVFIWRLSQNKNKHTHSFADPQARSFLKSQGITTFDLLLLHIWPLTGGNQSTFKLSIYLGT